MRSEYLRADTVLLRLLAVLVGIACVLSIVSCGSDDDGELSQSTSAVTGVPAAEGKVNYPITLETPWGSTVLEKRPTRIATLGFTGVDTEIALALGVTPIYAGDFDGAPWISENGGSDIEETYPSTEMANGNYPYEEIAKSRPDLIIATGMDLSPYFDRFASIAPVLAAENQSQINPSEFSWKRRLDIISEALDLKSAGKEFISSYDDMSNTIKGKHPEFSELTASFVIWYPKSTNYSYDNVEWLHDFFGFAIPESADMFRDDPKVSDELISKVDADVMVLTENNTAPIEDLISKPAFRSLGAVKNGNLVVIPHSDNVTKDGNFPAAVGYGGPLAKMWAGYRLLDLFESELNI